jgi:hypothetical protein
MSLASLSAFKPIRATVPTRFGSSQAGNIKDFEQCLDYVLTKFQNLSQPQLGDSDKEYDYPYVHFIHAGRLHTFRSLGVKKPTESAFTRLHMPEGEFSVLQSNDYTKYNYFKDGKAYTVMVENVTPIPGALKTKISGLWEKLEKEVWDRV